MDIETLVDADEAFHLGIAALAGNSERRRYLANINARIRFVRRINLEDASRRESSLKEHSDILDAFTGRRGEEAAALMKQHLRLSSEELKDHIKAGLARIYADDIT